MARGLCSLGHRPQTGWAGPRDQGNEDSGDGAQDAASAVLAPGGCAAAPSPPSGVSVAPEGDACVEAHGNGASRKSEFRS